MNATWRSRTRRLVGLLGLLVHAAPLRAQPVAPQGWSFTWTITTNMQGQSAPGPGVGFDVVVWNGVARITPRPGQPTMRALFGDAGVILAQDRDSLLTILNHPRRDALRATLGELAAMGGGPGGMQVTVSDVASATRSVGTAPPLDGLTARRIALDQRYTMSVRVQEMQRTVVVSEITTLDLTATLDARGAGFRAFASQFLRAMGKPREVRAALQQREGRLPRGVPVRTRAETITIAGSDTLRAVSVGSMSGLQRVTVDTTTFQVPAGYRVTEARRLLRSRGAP